MSEDIKSAVRDALNILRETEFSIENESSIVRLASKVMVIVEKSMEEKAGSVKLEVVLGVLHFLVNHQVHDVYLREGLNRFIDKQIPVIVEAIVSAAKESGFSRKAKSWLVRLFKKLKDCDCKC